jgi:uncharacterized membrane protein
VRRKKRHQFIVEEELQLKKLDDLVNSAIAEEKLLSHKILEAERDDCPGFGQRVADRIADVGGSWTFIIGFVVVLLSWIGINALFLSKSRAFDPYPFILLNLVLSCVAALQAPIIMMSQKRQEEKDRKRARNDYMVNLKAELEVRALHEKINLLLSEQMKSLFEVQKKQMEILDEIKKDLKQFKLRGDFLPQSGAERT